MLIHIRHFLALVLDVKLGFEVSTSRSVTSVIMRYFVEFHCRLKDEAVECEEVEDMDGLEVDRSGTSRRAVL